MADLSAWGVARARAGYAIGTILGRPKACVLDRVFAACPDFYRMRDYGDERMDAVADVIRDEVGSCASLGDVSVYEGYTLGRVAARLGVSDLSGCDLSQVALERARAELAGWIESGMLTARTTVYEGLSEAPQAFVDLLAGRTVGTTVVTMDS